MLTMQDLFDKRTKEAKLEEWCKVKKIFSKVDVLKYGLENWYIRADRSVRDLVQQSKVMRLYNPNSKMAWYRYIE